jgi:translocator protein
MIKKILKLLFILAPLMLGFFISSFFSANSEWYKSLKKPEYMPPSMVFSIVWSVLYVLFGISMYLAIYNKSLSNWIIPGIHFGLNLMFSPIMFGANNLLWAFIITIAVLLSGVIMIWQFYNSKSNLMAIYLLIPYFIWLLFASYLSYDIYRLNIGL